jgi:hypothetical protein
MTTTVEFHDKDVITLKYTVDAPAGADQPDFSGATIEATAKNAATGDKVTLAASVLDAPTRRIGISIAKDSVTSGVWRLQAYITLTTGEAQTPVDEYVTVDVSN